MLDKEKDGLGLPPISSVVIILIVIGAVFFSMHHLKSSRPTDNGTSEYTREIEDVRARLWQDPFDAVYKHEEDESLHNGAHSRYVLEKIIDDNDLKEPGEIHIIGVMAEGGHYFENVEQKRRRRYAVVSALNVSGYKPDDAQKIGYFLMGDYNEENVKLSEKIPFELFKYKKNDKSLKDKPLIILLWLDEESFADNFLLKMDALTEALHIDRLFENTKPENVGVVKFTIIGPSSSTTLKSMAEELKDAVPITVDDDLEEKDFFNMVESATKELVGRQLKNHKKLTKENKEKQEKQEKLEKEMKEDIVDVFKFLKKGLLLPNKKVLGNEEVLYSKVENKLKNLKNLKVTERDESGLSNPKTDDSKWSNYVDLDKVCSQIREKWHHLKKLRFTIFSPIATVEKDLLSDEKDIGVLFSENFPNGRFLRTIKSDYKLAERIYDELKLRGVKPGMDHIVLISEWDTDYGHWIKSSFKRAFKNKHDKYYKHDKHDKHDKYYKHYKHYKHDKYDKYDEHDEHEHDKYYKYDDKAITEYSYIRGLDGQISDDLSIDPSSRLQLIKDNNNREKGYNTSRGYANPSAGNGQFDYLQRMGDMIQNKNSKHKKGSKKRVKAIGVLGSDEYDKLLVLQALRKKFPEVIFFTTDLDARFSDPDEIKWTRNLIVSSNFGLQLHPDLQKDIPPFRDNYQTSVYFTTLLSLNANYQDAKYQDQIYSLIIPKVFEIGRDNAFELRKGKKVKKDKDNTYQKILGNMLGAFLGNSEIPSNIQIKPRDIKIENDKLFKYFFGILAAAILFVILFPKTPKFVLELIYIISILVFFNAVYFYSSIETFINNTLLIEPFTLTGGISIWPIELVRIVTIFLTLYFLYSSWNVIKNNNSDIEKEYFKNNNPTNDTKYEGERLILKFVILIEISIFYISNHNIHESNVWILILFGLCFTGLSWWIILPYLKVLYVEFNKEMKINKEVNTVGEKTENMVIVIRKNVGFIVIFVLIIVFALYAIEKENKWLGIISIGLWFWTMVLHSKVLNKISGNKKDKISISALFRRVSGFVKYIVLFVFIIISALFAIGYKEKWLGFIPIGLWWFLNWLFLESINTQLDEEKKDVQKIWTECRSDNVIHKQYWRTIIMMSYFVSVIFCLFESPQTPFRGNITKIIDNIIIIIAISLFSFLLFFVVDANRFCVKFVRQLMNGKSGWIQGDNKIHGERLLIRNSTCAHYWFRIKLIADRTEAINKLTNYPFVVILLILFSCNTYFDNFYIPPSLYILGIICVSIPVICGYNLRKEANIAKNKTLELLKNEVRKETYGICSGYRIQDKQKYGIDQINLIISDVQGIRKGAFVPLLRQPFVQSIVFFLGILGAVLSQYFANRY